MGASRNVVLTLAATAVLIGGLVVLFPSAQVSAAQVQLSSTGVSGVFVTDDGYAFDVTATVDIPEGEHIPLDFARVLVGNEASVFTSGFMGDDVCNVDTDDSTSGPHATILSVETEADYVSYGYSGVGYTVVEVPGYGYEFQDDGEILSGSGYGYGYGTEGTTAHITVRVTDCFDETLFTSSNLVLLRVQLLVGGTTFETLFPSIPVAKNVFNPEFESSDDPISADEENAEFIPTVSQSTEEFGIDLTFSNDLDANLAPGESITTTLPDGSPGTEVTLTVGDGTGDGLPAGSSVGISFSLEDPGSDDLLEDALGDGIDPASLPDEIAIYFDVDMTVPGVADADPNDYLESMVIEFEIPESFFTDRGVSPNGLRLYAFDSEGDSEGQLRPDSVNCVGGTCTFVFTIDRFSSFAGGMGTASGGGGGGGGSSDDTTDETSDDTTDETSDDTTDETSDDTTDETSDDASDDSSDDVSDDSSDDVSDDEKTDNTPAPAFALLALGLLGAAFVALRRKA